MMFRKGTIDEQVYQWVYEENEYGLPDDIRGARVLDVGAHIGSFTKLCLDRGAASVIAVEGNGENGNVLRQNVGENPTVLIVPALVGHKTQKVAFCPEKVGENTGMWSYLLSDVPPLCGIESNMIGLDAILDNYYIDFFKIDVEGSEVLALEGVKPENMFKVRYFFGEYHFSDKVKAKSEAILGYELPNLYDWFGAKMQAFGFKHTLIPSHIENQGLFKSWR